MNGRRFGYRIPDGNERKKETNKQSKDKGTKKKE